MSSALHLLPLCQLAAGATGRICVINGDDGFAQRLREMGFGEAALVTKISGRTTSHAHRPQPQRRNGYSGGSLARRGSLSSWRQIMANRLHACGNFSL